MFFLDAFKRLLKPKHEPAFTAHICAVNGDGEVLSENDLSEELVQELMASLTKDPSCRRSRSSIIKYMLRRFSDETAFSGDAEPRRAMVKLTHISETDPTFKSALITIADKLIASFPEG